MPHYQPLTCLWHKTDVYTSPPSSHHLFLLLHFCILSLRLHPPLFPSLYSSVILRVLCSLVFFFHSFCVFVWKDRICSAKIFTGPSAKTSIDSVCQQRHSWTNKHSQMSSVGRCCICGSSLSNCLYSSRAFPFSLSQSVHFSFIQMSTELFRDPCTLYSNLSFLSVYFSLERWTCTAHHFITISIHLSSIHTTTYSYPLSFLHSDHYCFVLWRIVWPPSLESHISGCLFPIK